MKNRNCKYLTFADWCASVNNVVEHHTGFDRTHYVEGPEFDAWKAGDTPDFYALNTLPDIDNTLRLHFNPSFADTPCPPHTTRRVKTAKAVTVLLSSQGETPFAYEQKTRHFLNLFGEDFAITRPAYFEKGKARTRRKGFVLVHLETGLVASPHYTNNFFGSLDGNPFDTPAALISASLAHLSHNKAKFYAVVAKTQTWQKAIQGGAK